MAAANPKNVCPNCKSADIEEDPGRGDAVCMKCGAVLEENAIVSEIQFQETGAGGHSLVGKFVSAEAPGRVAGIAGLQGYVGKESSEVTLQNGRRRILDVASQLRLNQHCTDTAFNFFKMAVRRGLTRGRRSTHTIAACLYITCRLEGTAHLLLDFSDVLRVNVFELGRVYSFLARTLSINLPPTDPCLYVMRFAHALKFEDKENDVANLAMRLVTRMKRDWMAVGRRPHGLCGAALLLAARYFSFNRSIQDVINVVQIGESAVRKRLNEFAQTASSALTLDEFANVDLEEEADPPAFLEAKKQRYLKSTNIQLDELDSMQAELTDVEKQVEEQLERSRKTPRGPYAKLAKEALAAEIVGSLDTPELREAESFLRDELLEDVMNGSTWESAKDSDASALEETPSQRLIEFHPTLESLGINRPSTSTGAGIAAAGASAAGDSNLSQAAPLAPDDGELNLEGIDDSELDAYLLNEEEAQMKSRIWLSMNGKFIETQEQRRRERAEELEAKKNKPKRKRAKKKHVQFASASEAIEKIVQERRLSSKINYDALRNLGGSGSGDSRMAVKKEMATKLELKPIIPKPVEDVSEQSGTEDEEMLSAADLLRRHQNSIYGEKD